MPIPIDTRADTYGLPKCLWMPIAVRDEAALERYVGKSEVISGRTPNKAFLVHYHGAIEPPDENLGIWSVPGAEALQAKRQIWAHVNYTGYRRAYEKHMLTPNIEDCVIDHLVNRRFARLLGCNFVRLLAISRSCNTSSGAGPESEAVKAQQGVYGEPYRDEAEVYYADPSDIVKMLNMKTGHFPLRGVGEALRLMYLPSSGTSSGSCKAVNVRRIERRDENGH